MLGSYVLYAHWGEHGRKPVETLWDWLTVFCFAGLVTLLLQRSTEDAPRDKLWQYAPPAVGLAAANYVGNRQLDWLAVLLMGVVAGYVIKVLRPRITRG
jgi:hypothetical protein